MNENKQRERQGGLLGVLPLASLLLVPVLYVLSSGPALWVTVNAPLPAALWDFVYYPLTFCRDLSPQFHQTFQRYLDFWTK